MNAAVPAIGLMDYRPQSARVIERAGTMRKRAFIAATAALVICSTDADAASGHVDKGIESAGQDVAIALPFVAGAVSMLHDQDWDGLGEFTESTVLTVGSALLLKQIVHERRPDHSDYQSFPSDTAALAYSSADYMWDRYGWEYGVPAYAAAMFVGYSRVKAKKHHWYDVAASSAIAFGFNYAFVTRYHANDRFRVEGTSDGDSVGVRVAMSW